LRSDNMPCEIIITRKDYETIRLCGECKNILSLPSIICHKKIRKIFVRRVPTCIVSGGDNK